MNLNYFEVDIDNKESIIELKKFYQLLEENFKKDERESYKQIVKTLNKKKTNFFGKNSYHILLVKNKNKLIGGIIYDYFYKSNSSMIEYIVINKENRRKNLATKLLKETAKRLNKEAITKGYDKIDFVVCELNSKKERHYFWEKFNFKELKFNYIQPALDKNKKILKDMKLGIVTRFPNIYFTKKQIETKKIKSILYDYSYYTMRIKNPKKEEYFIKMVNELKEKDVLTL